MKHVTSEEAAGMIELAVKGRTQREIAEETGRTLVTVNKTIQKAARQIADIKPQSIRRFWENITAV